jgi:transposase-like protein
MHQLLSSLFRGRHFDRTVIILCVRWYITYKLSYRDLVEMMAERGVDMSHTTILRWVQCYVPEFEKRWNKYIRPVGKSWRVDETYIKIKGKWTYLYRAVDKQGLTVDFLLSEQRDIAAAKRFFAKAILKHGPPERITVDGYPATHTALNELKAEEVLPQETRVRTSKYLNNLIEQDHRQVKQRIYPMLGFKRFENAAIAISGIELAQKIKKGQFYISAASEGGAGNPRLWDVVLAT